MLVPLDFDRSRTENGESPSFFENPARTGPEGNPIAKIRCLKLLVAFSVEIAGYLLKEHRIAIELI